MQNNLKKIEEIITITNDYIVLIKSDSNLLYKKEYLINMLLTLDCILTDNNIVIKNMRKKLIVRINNTLDYIEYEICIKTKLTSIG